MAKMDQVKVPDEWDYISCESNIEPSSRPTSPLPKQHQPIHSGWCVTKMTKTRCVQTKFGSPRLILKTKPRAKKIKIFNPRTKKLETWELTPLVQVFVTKK